MEVTFENLSKHFGSVKAVDDLNLKIKDGEFIALLGPSGCGKTTTLLMVAGVYKPTKGYIYFGERIVNEVLPKDRNIGMVFQDYALYPHMTVFDNIVFPLKLQKIPKKEMKKRAEEVAKLVQIEDLLGRKPSQLSGGQQQRVALSRALVKKPNILLLDEPLSNLDARLRITMRAELKRLQKELGITTIFVTHDQIEALTMADRIAVMNQGKLQQFSTPDELYNSPNNLFVASFIGTPPMNLIEVSLKSLEDKFFVQNKDLQIELPSEVAQKAKNSTSDKMVIGIRPEDIVLDQKKGIEAEVYVMEPLGRDLLITFKIGQLTLKVLTSPTFAANIGDKVWLKLNMDKIHLFDKETGESLLLET
jgi:ABC-type sugar transport system ATPase subunit